MKSNFNALAHVLSLPPCLVLLAYLIPILLRTVFDLGPDPAVLNPFLMIILPVYYFLPNVGVVYLLIWAYVLLRAWRYEEKTHKLAVLLPFYLIVLVALVIYVIWWYATGQEFSYL